jgi:integrase
VAETIKLTKSAVDRIPFTAHGQELHYDSELSGFGLRVGARSKAYFAEWKLHGRKTRRVTIGRHGPFTPETARRRAMSLLADMQSGIDPTAERRKEQAKGVTLQQAYDAFKLARKGLKPVTIRDYDYCVATYFSRWRDIALTAITKDKVAERHAALGEISPARANLAMRFLRALFNFAIQKYEPHITENPVKHLSATKAWYRVERRKTYIKPHELRPWFKAVTDLENDFTTQKREVLRDYLLLILFTGLRREEAARLTWDRVDFKAKTFTVTDTKNREDHTLPMSDFIITLLKRRKAEAGEDDVFVFPGEGRSGHVVEPRKQILRVCRESGVEFRVHDLRRTFATIAESLDIPGYALKRLLNHKMTGDITAGYIIADVERLRQPMQKITDFILKAAGAKASGQVLQLQKRVT